MRRTAFVLLATLALVLAPALADQKKPKDEALHQYLITEFAQLNAKVDKLDERLSERLTALDAKLGELKQQQNDLKIELRDAQNISKSIDTSLGSFRLSSQQDLLSLKTDLTQTRQEFQTLSNLIQKSAAAAAAKPPEAPLPALATLEGYITAVDENAVTINLGSSVRVNVGARFSVFKAADPHAEVGVVEVTQVIDANNSRAKIIYSKSDIHFDFSDMVRLK